jgi:multiple sugar transport system permease protein
LAYFGTASGLVRKNTFNNKVQIFDNLVPEIDINHKIAKDGEYVQGNVSAIAKYKEELIIGSSFGEVIKLNEKTGEVNSFFQTKEGHVLFMWKNYLDLWKNIDFGLYLWNSLRISFLTMFFAMIFATLTAYALVRYNFPGSRFFSTSILATQMVPGILYLIPLYIMFKFIADTTGIQIKGTVSGLVFIYTAFFVPFSIWILRGFFAAIPRELEESATIDGCSQFRVFWNIVLPLAVPGIIATGVYIFLNAWDELMFAWVLTNKTSMTIPVGIRLFVGNFQNRFDLMMAAATVATVPVIILFFILQKHIVKGLTAGAVKG